LLESVRSSDYQNSSVLEEGCRMSYWSASERTNWR